MNYKTEYVLEFYDFTRHDWVVLYKTYYRKLAIHQLNKCKHCFSNIKYRLFQRERII